MIDHAARILEAVPAATGSFQSLLYRHSDNLIHYISHFIPDDLRSLIDPQDVAQDTFFTAARNAESGLPVEPNDVWRWLVTVARNRLRNLIVAHRAAKRGGLSRTINLDAGSSDSVIAALSDLAVHYRTPSKSAIRRESLALLEQCVSKLEPHYRDAVRARYIQGSSVKETAEHLRKTPGAAEKILSRALSALRLELAAVSVCG